MEPTQPSPLFRAGAKLMGTGAARRFLRRYGWRIDRAVIKATNGHMSMSLVMPEVLLTHTGAKTGKKRTTPLTYFTDRGRVIVIASNYGGDRHPAWFHNVKAHPRVTLSTRGYTGTFVGEEITDRNATGCSDWPSSSCRTTPITRSWRAGDGFRSWRSPNSPEAIRVVGFRPFG